MNTIEQQYQREFTILKENGNLTGDWSNVYDHCKTEAVIADLLSDMLNLSANDRVYLVRAAILHDWYKRTERESKNYDTTYSEQGLKELGIDSQVIEIAHSVGHTSLKWIEGSYFLRKVMHFIDDICVGSDIVEIDERVNKTEASGRYTQLIEDYRKELDGRNFFDVQKEVGKIIQNEIEDKCGISHGSLVTVIKQKLGK